MFNKYVAQQIKTAIMRYEAQELPNKGEFYQGRLVIDAYADELALAKKAELDYLYKFCTSIEVEPVYQAAKKFAQQQMKAIADTLESELDLADDEIIVRDDECDNRYKGIYNVHHHRISIPEAYVEQLKHLLKTENNIVIPRRISALG